MSAFPTPVQCFISYVPSDLSSYSDDGEVLKPLLLRLTSATDLPILVIGGKPIGSMAEIRALQLSGELQTMISQAGAIVDGAKKKKGRK